MCRAPFKIRGIINEKTQPVLTVLERGRPFPRLENTQNWNDRRAQRSEDNSATLASANVIKYIILFIYITTNYVIGQGQSFDFKLVLDLEPNLAMYLL